MGEYEYEPVCGSFTYRDKTGFSGNLTLYKRIRNAYGKLWGLNWHNGILVRYLNKNGDEIALKHKNVPWTGQISLSDYLSSYAEVLVTLNYSFDTKVIEMVIQMAN